jgi:hypothetical protein
MAFTEGSVSYPGTSGIRYEGFGEVHGSVGIRHGRMKKIRQRFLYAFECRYYKQE